MRMKHEPAGLSLEVEPLENRRLLAGNVTAALTPAGDLRINGDAQDNRLLVSTPIPGFVTITGEIGTTVNGSIAPVNLSLASFGGVLPDDVIINLRGGDDSVIVGNIGGTTQVGDQLVIIAGAGNDTVGVYDVAASDLRVIGGAGDDAIAVVGSSIVDSVFFATAGGADAIYFDCSLASNNARLITGGGDDGIFFASYSPKLLVVTGGGNDLVAIGDTLLGVDQGRFVLGGGNDVIAFSDAASVTSHPTLGGGGADTTLIGPGFLYVNDDLKTETVTVGTQANDLAVATVVAFQAQWGVRGMSPLIFVC